MGKQIFDAPHLGENIDMCIFTVTTFRLIKMVIIYIYYKNIRFTYVIQAIFHSRIRTAYLKWHISPKLAKTHITP